jgi:hypothetical protein
LRNSIFAYKDNYPRQKLGEITMALARETTAANIKPLGGAVVRRVTAGAAIAVGEAITLQSDGYWDPTNTSAAQLTVRIAVQAASAAGDVIDSVVSGPVQCLTGATIGSLVYATDTAGEPSHTAGTKTTIIGYAETATILFVQPQINDLV